MYSKGNPSYLYLPVNVELSAIENAGVLLIVSAAEFWAETLKVKKQMPRSEIKIVFFIRADILDFEDNAGLHLYKIICLIPERLICKTVMHYVQPLLMFLIVMAAFFTT
jgi:hypothetical protein